MSYTPIQTAAIEEISGTLQINNPLANSDITILAAEVVVTSVYKFLSPTDKFSSRNILNDIPLEKGEMDCLDLLQIIMSVDEEIDNYYNMNKLDYNSEGIDDETAGGLIIVRDLAIVAYNMLEPSLHMDED